MADRTVPKLGYADYAGDSNERGEARDYKIFDPLFLRTTALKDFLISTKSLEDRLTTFSQPTHSLRLGLKNLSK